MSAKTLYDKLWESHLVHEDSDGTALIYIDRHLVHEVTSPQAYEGLKLAGRKVWRIDSVVATADHNTPTRDWDKGLEGMRDKIAKLQVETLDKNIKEHGAKAYFPFLDQRQGIVHVIGPELGASLPGMTLVCGDSHTSTHGALGALAFGIGTSEVEHVLATQCLVAKKTKAMQIRVEGELGAGVTAKDVVLAVIGKIGSAGGTGYSIEFAGSAIRSLSMEGRMTVCNMAIEAGARAGMVAPDDTTFEYLAGRPMAPVGEAWERAVADWRTLASDPGASYDRSVSIDVSSLEPQVTWGTDPGMVMAVSGRIPETTVPGHRKALEYMGLKAGAPIAGQPVQVVFIGSCTNSRLSDLRAAADVLRGRRVARGVRALVVPGSQQTRRLAEAEGLDQVFIEAGAEWHQSGCSLCIAMNGDRAAAGQYVVSTSNRNFEGRQGQGARTLLASPVTAAASAVAGVVADPRPLLADQRRIA
jgi:3-isopropylmalate/(R)-2-methylmalate dehydratase large subunit